ncbi:MAG: AraC family transcriptional regulator ligand-binding domain-containing protein, partial [Mangrovicoccus sp.]
MTSQTLGSDPHYTVPVYWVREVIELLLPEHPRWVARALGAAALHWSELSEENAKIGQIQEVDFIQALARLSDNPYFAPEIGLRLNGRTSSVVSYILHSARTMGEAMTINAQILPLTRPGFVVEAHADGVAGRFVVGNRDPWVRRHPAYGEFMMSAAISAYRTATGRLIHPIQVQLAQPQSSRGPRLSHLWGCPVVMEAPFHAVDFGAELMDLPLVQSDAALHQ